MREDKPVSNNVECQTRLIFSKGDYQSIIGQLGLINWDGEMDGLDFSGSWTWFTGLYIDLLEKFIPESKPRQNHGKNGPPITLSYRIEYLFIVEYRLIDPFRITSFHVR